MMYEENINLPDNMTEAQSDIQPDFLKKPDVKLTKEEIGENMKKAVQGDKEARELLCLVKRNDIISIACRYSRRGPSMQQIIDAAKKGFIDAVCVFARNLENPSLEDIMAKKGNSKYIELAIKKEILKLIESKEWDGNTLKNIIVKPDANAVQSDTGKPERAFSVTRSTENKTYTLSELNRRNMGKRKRNNMASPHYEKLVMNSAEYKNGENPSKEAARDKELDELLSSVGDYKALDITPEENQILLKKMMQGDKKAEEKFCRANMRFVADIARRYSLYGVDFKELFDEGCRALVDAVKSIDGQFNKVKIGSYIRNQLKMRVGMFVSDEYTADIETVLTRDMIKKHNEVEKELLRELGRRPTFIEIAERMGVADDVAISIYSITHRSKPENEDELQRIRYEKRLAREKAYAKKENGEPARKIKKRLLSREVVNEVRELYLNYADVLSFREEEVLRMRYGIRNGKLLTLAEVGSIIGLTRERIRQVEARAIRKMRERKDTVNSAEENGIKEETQNENK